MRCALVEAVHAVLGRGLGTHGHYFSRSSDGSSLAVMSPVFVGCDEKMFNALSAAAKVAKPEETLGAYRSAYACQSLSQSAKRIGWSHAESHATRLMVERVGVHDQLIVTAIDGDGRGCAFGVPLPRVMRFPARSGGTMARVMRHVAVALRLKRRRETVATSADVDTEAVVDELGRVLHADGVARKHAARAALSHAARVMYQNRTQLRSAAPEQAIKLWSALIEGRWSLVDTVDSDGKRLLLARKNRLELPEPRALTPDERYVAALVARGHSLKLICYELGLAPATVSERLARAIRKLGLGSRTELMRLFGHAATRLGSPV